MEEIIKVTVCGVAECKVETLWRVAVNCGAGGTAKQKIHPFPTTYAHIFLYILQVFLSPD